jgi:hypothetical protein
MKRVSAGVSRLISSKKRLDAASEGLSSRQPRLAASPEPSV